jgi:signal transduction histidine kinase
MNLAENATRHTNVGDRISLGTTLSDDVARLWVSDSGPGIPPEQRERIFERFAAGADGGVAGLGLAIVRAIAEAHGGWVELDSTVGEGSTFTIVIPGERGAV